MSDSQNAAYRPAALLAALVLGAIALGLIAAEVAQGAFNAGDSWLAVIVIGMVAVVVLQLRARSQTRS